MSLIFSFSWGQKTLGKSSKLEKATKQLVAITRVIDKHSHRPLRNHILELSELVKQEELRRLKKSSELPEAAGLWQRASEI